MLFDYLLICRRISCVPHKKEKYYKVNLSHLMLPLFSLIMMWLCIECKDFYIIHF